MFNRLITTGVDQIITEGIIISGSCTQQANGGKQTAICIHSMPWFSSKYGQSMEATYYMTKQPQNDLLLVSADSQEAMAGEG